MDSLVQKLAVNHRSLAAQGIQYAVFRWPSLDAITAVSVGRSTWFIETLGLDGLEQPDPIPEVVKRKRWARGRRYA